MRPVLWSSSAGGRPRRYSPSACYFFVCSIAQSRGWWLDLRGRSLLLLCFSGRSHLHPASSLIAWLSGLVSITCRPSQLRVYSLIFIYNIYLPKKSCNYIVYIFKGPHTVITATVWSQWSDFSLDSPILGKPHQSSAPNRGSSRPPQWYLPPNICLPEPSSIWAHS